MLEKRKRVYGLALAFLAVLTASIAPALIKVGIDTDVHPLTLLMFRLWISAIIFWVFFSIAQPTILRIDRKALAYSFAAGIANSTGLMLFYYALQQLDASIATMIFAFYPLFTILLLALRGEQIQLGALLCLGISLLGIYLLVEVVGSFNYLGAVFVLGTTFGYALHLNIVQWYLNEYTAQTSAVYIITSMAIITTLAWLIGPGGFSQISTMGWLSIVGTALFSTVLTRLALFAAIRRVGSAQVSFFGPIEILLGVIWAVFLLGEHLSLIQWLGGMLILASMIWIMGDKQPPKKERGALG
jgi:drug/metabolite transporter (DMT)-like permease